MGKLIVFEGTDGSGKSTQFSLLTRRLEARGVDFRTMVFPQYTEPSSALIRMYLGGEFGARPSDVNAYTASTFYAVDRFAAFRKVWGEYYRNGGLMLSDRYTTSNAVHQASKEPEQDREKFFAWLYDLEYRHMGLPVPDLVLYLDVPTELTGQMLRRREHDTHTHADIHEQNMDYLRRCRATGLQAQQHIGGVVDAAGFLEGVHGDLKVVVLPVEGGDGEHRQLVLPGHFFQGADDAVQVLLVGEVDVHRGDDLEVVDEHHRLFAGLRDVAGHLALDVVEAGLVVALPEPEMSGVGGVGRFGPLQMLPLL